MRVLAVTPLQREPDGRARLYGRALKSLYAQQWPFALDLYQPLGGDDYADPNGTVTRKYAAARCVFLEGDWDAMLCAEADMILPADALLKLAALGADIAYGLYVFRHHLRTWSAYTMLTERQGVSLSADRDAARAAWGGVLPVAGVGMGCTLIRRHVLEALPFRNWRGVAQDWALGVDAQAAGFSQVCDLSVVCGHMTPDWVGEVYWPDPEARYLYRVEKLA